MVLGRAFCVSPGHKPLNLRAAGGKAFSHAALEPRQMGSAKHTNNPRGAAMNKQMKDPATRSGVSMGHKTIIALRGKPGEMVPPGGFIEAIRGRVRRAMAVTALLTLALLLASCGQDQPPGTYQGYMEAELTYIGAPRAGRLQDLAVKRGHKVKGGAALFRLDDTIQLTDRNQAAEDLKAARDNLADLKKGERPSEIEALLQQLAKSKATLDLARQEYEWRLKAHKTRAVSTEDLHNAAASFLSAQADVKEQEADLATARLGSREDQIKQASDQVKAREAALQQAEWLLAQMNQNAPAAATVFDTFYTRGEWVEAGQPVLALLVPSDLKVRFFVPEPEVSAIKLGQKIALSCDGCPKGMTARVNYIKSQVEYTPPVIYSADMRSKLVVMVEARPGPKGIEHLHPGLPVDVSTGASGASK
jgi:HlyD family secretion protein